MVRRSSRRLACSGLEGLHEQLAGEIDTAARHVVAGVRHVVELFENGSACSAEMAVILATSRLTRLHVFLARAAAAVGRWRSRRGPPGASPPCGGWAALRLPFLVVFRIMLTLSRLHQFSSSRIQVRRICADMSGSLAIFSRRCLASTSAFLVMTGRQLEGAEGLRVHLGLQGVAFGELRLDLVLHVVPGAEAIVGVSGRGDPEAGSVAGGARRGRSLFLPPLAANDQRDSDQNEQSPPGRRLRSSASSCPAYSESPGVATR